MRKKLITILVVFAFLSITTFSVINFATGSVEPTTPFDIEPIYDSKYTNILTLEDEIEPPNSPWHYPTINDYTGGLEWLYFENIFNGTNGNIWVALDPLYDWYVDNGDPGYSPDDVWFFSYPWTDTGLPDEGYPGGYYLPEGYVDYITGADLLEVLNEFDSNIHDTDVEYFGMYNNDPAERPGPYGDGTVQIMVFNVKDEFFYFGDSPTGFIEGYFWSRIADAGVNAFHMDTYQWWRRQGETPPMVDPYNGFDYNYLSIKAWEYEGTFAHEFQHLIHYDRDFDELSWVDEGCATLAEWLCGYGFSPGHISEYLLWFWDTPLTLWEGYLADYGASFLWTFYMYEHYGGAELLTYLVEDQANGIEGWVNALNAMGIKRSFDQIFQDWCIANYLDDPSLDCGRYGYFELDIPSENSEGLSIPYVMELWDSWYPDTGYFEWFVDKYPYEGEYILVGRGLPYTASYVEFTNTPRFFDIGFDGDDFAGAVYPYSGTYEWYSDGSTWSWFRFGQTFTIPEGGATLTFQTYYEIETDWDYGYVEIHDVLSDTWYTLPGLLTTDILLYDQDNINCPDDVEPYAYNASNNWNAFTGFSPGWYQEIMDLTAFEGRTIELYFTYWTDGAYNEIGWYIDDIEITEIGFFDDVESGSDGWVVNAGWEVSDGFIWNDFKVSFITSTTYYKKDGTPFWTWDYITPMWLSDETQEGTNYFMTLKGKRWETTIVMVAANQPGYEHAFGAWYYFNAHPRNWHHFWHHH
ncbi:MAG: hypothetical protein ACFFCV_03840 [Promethearchaeota archaeon]